MSYPPVERRWRSVLTVVLALYGWLCLTSPATYRWLDSLDLAIHETGHLVFAFGGETLTLLGGTLFQLIVPAAFVALVDGTELLEHLGLHQRRSKPGSATGRRWRARLGHSARLGRLARSGPGFRKVDLSGGGRIVCCCDRAGLEFSPYTRRPGGCSHGTGVGRLPAMNPHRWLAFLLGLIFGAAIWLLSPWITGRSEPWDAEGWYYRGTLLAAGLLGGLLVPQNWPSVALGTFAGQLLVILGGVLADPASGALWPLGLVFLGMYTVLALIGALLGAALRRGRGPSTGARGF
jgi:hypothetical protein